MATDALSARVDDLARRVGRIEDTNPAVTASQVSDIRGDIEELKTEVKGLRRAVIAFAFTVAGSAVGFALTVIYVWGGG